MVTSQRIVKRVPIMSKVTQKSSDKLGEICLKRAYELYPDLISHEITDYWFDDEGAFVIKSKFTNENGTQIYFTRLSF